MQTYLVVYSVVMNVSKVMNKIHDCDMNIFVAITRRLQQELPSSVIRFARLLASSSMEKLF